MKSTLILFAFTLSFFSCGGDADKRNLNDSAANPVTATTSVTPIPNAPSGDTTVHDPSRVGNNGQVPPQTGDTVRFMVSFISKGFGIDTKSKAHFDKWISDRGNIQYTASPWGREGEMSYCFPLKGKSAAEQEAFIRDAKNELPNRDLVVFSENIPCEKRR